MRSDLAPDMGIPGIARLLDHDEAQRGRVPVGPLALRHGEATSIMTCQVSRSDTAKVALWWNKPMSLAFCTQVA